MGFFDKFKRRCTHCGSTKLSSKTEKANGYGNKVFTETFICLECGAESTKSTVLKKKDKVPLKFKKIQ